MNLGSILILQAQGPQKHIEPLDKTYLGYILSQSEYIGPYRFIVLTMGLKTFPMSKKMKSGPWAINEGFRH